ncbi:MAG: GspH/FimT family protein [Burkholderiales bacterium]
MKSSKFSGLTMVEIIVVIGIISIMFTMAIPSFQAFYVKNVTSSAANELMGSLIQAKSVASTRNTCIVVCRSTTAEDSSQINNQSCSGTTGDNWQSGWIIFSNPNCDAGLTSLQNNEGLLIGIKNSLNSNILLNKSAGPDYIMFSPFGYPRGMDAGFLDLKYNGSAKNRICLNAAGNIVSVAAGGNCP